MAARAKGHEGPEGGGISVVAGWEGESFWGGGFLFANGPLTHTTVLLFECGEFSAPSFLLLLLLLLLLLACLRLGLALQDDVLFPSLFTSL